MFACFACVNFAGASQRSVSIGFVTCGRSAAAGFTSWQSAQPGNKARVPPLKVPIGRGRVIKGWDEGILGMRVGGRRQLVIPPELAYGSNRSGVIPPDAVLVFDIRVLSAK